MERKNTKPIRHRDIRTRGRDEIDEGDEEEEKNTKKQQLHGPTNEWRHSDPSTPRNKHDANYQIWVKKRKEDVNKGLFK